MKTSKRLFSLLLAVFLCITCFIGCDTESSNENDETTKDKKPSTSVQETTNPISDDTTKNELTTAPISPVTTVPNTSGNVTCKPTPDDAPATPEHVTYPDQTITIISRGYNWFRDEIYVEVETGDAVADMVWLRNDLIQRNLGITVTPHFVDSGSAYSASGKVLDEIEKQLNSGLNDYSIAVAGSYSVAAKTMENYFVDLTKISPFFDLKKPYWSQSLNDSFSIGDAQYICTGDMLLSYHRLMYGTLFNKTMFEEYGVDAPYDKVDDKEWTIAYQRSLIETFCDANTDQDPDATYGFVVNHDNISVDPYLSALKIPLITKDANNALISSVDMNRTQAAMQELSDLIYPKTKGTLRIDSYGNDSEQIDIAKKFASGEAAMVHLRMIELQSEQMLQMEDAYGILPMPMLNSEQDGYYTTLHDEFSVIAIPNTSKSADELEMIGAFLDLSGYYSYNHLTPAYYNLCLRGDSFDNPHDLDMLRILTDGIYVDPAIIYADALGSPLASWRSWVATNRTYINPSLKALGQNMSNNIKRVNSAFEKISK